MKLAKYVESPAVTEARLARQWGAIEPSVEATSRRTAVARSPRIAWGVAGALALVLAVGLVARPWRWGGAPAAAPAAFEGATLESAERESLALTDGSTVWLEPGTRTHVAELRADAVELDVERGGIELDVVHKDGRRFGVRAGRYEVVIVGTRLRVGVEGGRVSVAVERGKVEVRGGEGDVRVIGAGERWESAGEAPAQAQAQAQGQGQGQAQEQAPPAQPSARELLEEANEARTHGQTRQAATALDTLRRRFRGDARAALAAFELGRLRLDSLHDPAGAVEAFDDAIALAPGAPFREDAEARRVDALDAMSSSRCAAARDAYLARFPQGVHAATIARRCGGK
jgi:FecR-like protein